MNDGICWLVEDPENPPAFRQLLALLREDVPGACVAEYVAGEFTVFSALGEMPSLRRWESAGVPVWEIGPDPERLAEMYQMRGQEAQDG